jgi:predicted Zn-dependent protease with MMP-like domain
MNKSRRKFGKRKSQLFDRENDKSAAFERIVRSTIDSLPAEFRKAMRNLEIIVEDEPSADLLLDLGHDPKQPLLGLYVGVPLPERTYSEAPCLPDQIMIFRKPLKRICRNAQELREQIRITVIHELAHYFGFDEDHLRKLGLD